MEIESNKTRKILAILLVVLFIATMTATAVSASQCYGSSQSDVYHAVGCRYIRYIDPGNLITFSSEQAAIAGGYRACKVCGG